MVLRIKLTVFRTADFALCLVLAGRFPAGVLSQLLAAIITLVVFVIICALADYIIADITFMVLVCIDAILRLRACRASVNGAGAGMGAVFVGRPSSPVVVQRIAGEEGRLIRRALGAQTADCAGLVIDRLFGTSCSRLQILRLCFFGSEAVCRHLAVFAAADRADGPCRTGCRAAGAAVRLGVAAIALADARVRVVAVGGPCTPVVSEDVSSLEGRLRSRPRRAEAAGRAGLVIDRLFRAGRAGFQILRFRNFRREIMRQEFALFAAADRADSLGGAGRRAAVAILGFRMAGVTLTDSGVGLFIAVLRPSAPVVIQRGIRCGKRIGVVGAYFSARTG